MSNRQPPSNDELEIAEAKNPLTDLLYDYTAQAMTTRVGNYVYHRFDSCLSIVEKTAKWSLPQSPPPSEEDTSKMNISPPPLIRPLPWILFLPALIALRLVRASLSFVALLIGKQPVYPATMVSFLQSRRRKLRALKYRGQKLQRMKRAERESEENAEESLKANSWLQRITLPLRYIICLRAVRPGTSIQQQQQQQREQHHHHHHHHHHHRSSEKSRELGDEAARTKLRDESGDQVRRKRNAHERDADDSESSFEEASVRELLEKYANEDGDSSYHASDSFSSESDSFISESDKSHTETTEQNDSKKVKTENNGHATPSEKEADGVRKSEDPMKKSSLNAVDGDGAKPNESTKPAGSAETASAENGNAAPKKDPNVGTQTSDASQKSTKTSSGPGENVENKSAAAKNQPSEEGAKSDSSASHKSQSTAPSKEVKSSNQPKNKQQQQQNAHQQQTQSQQYQQQPSQQQGTAANGGGGGGKKQKKPYQHPPQQQQQQQQPQQN